MRAVMCLDQLTLEFQSRLNLGQDTEGYTLSLSRNDSARRVWGAPRKRNAAPLGRAHSKPSRISWALSEAEAQRFPFIVQGNIDSDIPLAFTDESHFIYGLFSYIARDYQVSYLYYHGMFVNLPFSDYEGVHGPPYREFKWQVKRQWYKSLTCL